MEFRQFAVAQIFFLCFAAISGMAQTLNDTLDSPLDGQVNAVLVNGSKVYFGGSFTRIGYSTGTGAFLDTTTALPDRTFPKVDPMGQIVLSSAPDGSGGLYIGGQFLYVNGVPRKYLAHIRADHSLDPWDPEPDHWVKVVSVSGDRLYVGGVFDSVAGQARGYAAAFNTSDGSLLPWNPQADNEVTAIQQIGSYVYLGGYFSDLHSQLHFIIGRVDTIAGNPDNSWSFYNGGPSGSASISSFVYSGGYLYAAGQFTELDSVNRNGLIKFDQTGNVVMSWNPGSTMSGGGGYASTLAVSGSTVFVGGSFTSIGGQSVNNLAAVDAGTGLASSSWTPNPNNNVTALAVAGSKLFVGGTFTSIGGSSVNNLAAIDVTTGNASTWDAKLYNTPSTVNVWTISPIGNCVFVGGLFYAAGQATRNGLASIDFTTGRITSWNPNATGGSVNAMCLANDKIIAGGSFTNVGASSPSIPNLVALDTSTGLPIHSPNWKGSAGGTVRALLTLGDRLYVAGDFFGLDNLSRTYLGDINKNDGTLLPWHPILDNGGVWSLASSGSKVFASGFFNHIGGVTRNYAAAFDTTIDSLTAWDPEPGYLCYSLATLGNKVYLGGSFFGVGSNSSIKSLAAVDTATGALISGFNANFALALSVYAMAARGSDLIIGGQMSSSYSPNRSALAILDASTGAVNSFNAHMNEDVGSATVYSIALGQHMLVVGGQFVAPNYFPQANLAAYGDTSILDTPLDIQATNFSAKSDAGSVTLTWKTASEVNNAGFNVLREDPGTSSFKLLANYVNDEALKGMGTSTVGKGYNFIDTKIKSGSTYHYKIQSVSTNGTIKDVNTLSVTADIPRDYALYQNYPNPFNPATTIQFDLKQTSTVTLEIFNVLGERIEQWSLGSMSAGQYSRDVNMNAFASGVYFYRIVAVGNDGQRFVSVKKLVLMK